jgi:hypothetical protein
MWMFVTDLRYFFCHKTDAMAGLRRWSLAAVMAGQEQKRRK